MRKRGPKTAGRDRTPIKTSASPGLTAAAQVRKKPWNRVETDHDLPISKLGIAKHRSQRVTNGSSLNCGNKPENRGLTNRAVTNSPEMVTTR
jgi:hypothetical protein